MIEYGLEWHSLDTYFQFKEVASAPSTPQANQIRLYAKDSSGTSTLCYLNDAGTEVCFPTSGPLITGSGVANQLAIWSGTSTLVGDTGLTFDTSTNIVTVTGGIISSDLTLGSVLFADTAGRIGQDNANLFWDNSGNLLGLGTVVPTTALHIVKDNLGAIQLDALTTVFAATFNGRGYRTSAAAPSVVVADDVLASFGGAGKITTGFSAAKAAVQMKAGETFSDTAQGAYLSLATTPLLSTTRAERFRIGPSGQWGIGGSTFGTSLDVFTSGGASAAPTWTAPGALTKTDDTNVTLTLGGTPTTALLRAASLTLGWTGTLAVARGGTGQSTVAGYNALLDHGALLGLSDDDHTQYALLAGRSGGQTLIGGTASGDDLTLKSTSNVTKGNIHIGTASTYDEVNDRFGLGQLSPTNPLHISGSSISSAAPNTGVIYVDSTLGGTANALTGLALSPTHTPTASVANRRALFAGPTFNPGVGATITNASVLEFTPNTGSGAGAITNLQGIRVGTPALGTIVPTSATGTKIFNQGVAGITTAIALQIDAQTGASANWGIQCRALADIDGIVTPKSDVTLANGVNSDITTSTPEFLRIIGPTAAFSTTGFTGGTDGRHLRVFNSVAQTWTITNEATSTAANRITTLTGADVVMRATAVSFADFIYDSGSSRWILTSIN